MEKIVQAINGVSNFFTNVYDMVITIGGFFVSIFDFIIYAVRTLFALFSSIL